MNFDERHVKYSRTPVVYVAHKILSIHTHQSNIDSYPEYIVYTKENTVSTDPSSHLSDMISKSIAL